MVDKPGLQMQMSSRNKDVCQAGECYRNGSDYFRVH